MSTSTIYGIVADGTRVPEIFKEFKLWVRFVRPILVSLYIFKTKISFNFDPI